MQTKSEQIEAILDDRAFNWANDQLGPGEVLDDHQYSDFISVTPDEVVAHALAHGFPARSVWAPGDPPSRKDDILVIEPKGAGWVTYYTERGGRDDERSFDTREGAVRDIVMRLMTRAWIALNHRYWHRHHPELDRLPPFGAPWR